MIPIGDDNRGRRKYPFLTLTFVAINVLVFLYQVSLPRQALEALILSYGAIPTELVQGVDIPPSIGYPVWVTVLSSMFMHGGWFHLIGNMLFLWVFGDNVEDTMGHGKYLLFYLLAGIGAVVGQILIDPASSTPMVGASGAISGVMAAYLVLYPGGLIRVLVFLGFFPLVYAVPAIVMIGIWILLQFLNGLASFGVPTEQTAGVAYFAHIGGFVAGLVLVWLFRDPSAHRRQKAARRGYRAFSRW